MKYLLDAHTLIWSQDDPVRLPKAVTTALADPSHERLLSIATIWEIGIKVSLGKLKLSKPLGDWIETTSADLATTHLPISLEHVIRQMGLPFHHRDPFDRLLVAQAFEENAVLLSGDAAFQAYGVNCMWG